MVLGFFLNGRKLRRRVRLSREFSDRIRTDADMYRTDVLLGGDYRLIEALRDIFPPGTRVAVADCPRSRYRTLRILGRRQRFWLPLLPDYPVGPSDLLICPLDQVRGGDHLVQRGELFALIVRSDGQE